MRTFLTGIFAPQGPLAKTLGILPQKHPTSLGAKGFPGNFGKLGLNISSPFGCEHF
jgi:hypothetical protein